jgi:hypothetical protein
MFWADASGANRSIKRQRKLNAAILTEKLSAAGGVIVREIMENTPLGSMPK